MQILAERFFSGSVRASTFTPDGRYLAGAGAGTMIWLAEMEPRVRPIRDLGTPPHHFEQINALTVWPDWSVPLRLALSGLLHPGSPVIPGPPRPPILISGSDDTTIRFWDLQNRSLLAAFCAASTEDDSPRPSRPGVRELDWVLYTPDGHFDASPEGRELVRFRRGDSGRAWSSSIAPSSTPSSLPTKSGLAGPSSLFPSNRHRQWPSILPSGMILQRPRPA